jgi:hypothetical protein
LFSFINIACQNRQIGWKICKRKTKKREKLMIVRDAVPKMSSQTSEEHTHAINDLFGNTSILCFYQNKNIKIQFYGLIRA